VSMGLTGIQLARQFGSLAAVPGRRLDAALITPPTLQATFWMAFLLIPLAAFFSAICVSLGILARSMKEGAVLHDAPVHGLPATDLSHAFSRN